jgi:hypothetical protein
MQQIWKLSVRTMVLVSIVGWLSAGVASAQKLAVEGNHFTVDDQARFLTFITYFDALDVPDDRIELDFNNLKNAVHIDGIRILPNWWTQASRETRVRTFAGNTVIDQNGNIREASWNKLVHVLDRARAYGLVVDVTWTAETIGPEGGSGSGTLDFFRYKQALGTITSRLAGPWYNHVLFDLQNESSNVGPLGVPLSDGQAGELTGHVHTIDPGRIVTVSVDQNRTAREAQMRAEGAGENVVAWHETRERSWYQNTASDVPDLRASGKPAYLQEPPKYDDRGATADDFLEAARRAKLAGAAAWCYHTSAGQSMNPGPRNPNGGIWDRITGASPDVDVNRTDNGVIANLSPRLLGVPWGISSSPSVTFYWDINYGGPSFSRSSDMDFVGWDWNDQISSIRIPPGKTVILYQDWLFGGGTLTLTGDIPDLRFYGWNDWASSIRIQ